MHKRSWTRAILAYGILSIIAVPPLLATEDSQFQSTARVGRSVGAPHGPGDRDPVATNGDDDMPDRDSRPRSPVPVANATATTEAERASWMRSLWMRLQELRDIRWRFEPRF